MRVPLAWLKHFLPKLPSTETLVETLVAHGLEVEEVIDQSKDFERVVVGEITAIRPHPNADKLRLAEVMVAQRGHAQEIVCGAPNIAVGQKVPVAVLGAKLPNGLTIEKRAIRGVESNGMLCAADELGLGSDHSGIMVLDENILVGTPFAAAIGLDGVVLDLTLPANRVDLMSMRGLAREIGVMLGVKAKLPTVKLRTTKGVQKKTTTVSVASSKLAPLYAVRILRDVNVQPSPSWLQNYLRQAGMRPINSIVDATNVVMLEYGQPLHAFDADKIVGKITVRTAADGETLVTLDGQTRQLNSDMIVIADDTGPIALAGVMGGQSTEVSSTTKNIILESAIFHSVSIRKTSRLLGLVSEASKRFEKGLWLSLPTEASAAAAALIIKLGGGTVESRPIVAGATNSKPLSIQFDPAYVSARLGRPVKSAAVKKILSRLGFEVTGKLQWTVTVPAWRPDVRVREEVVDEVARILGYAETTTPLKLTTAVAQDLPRDIRFKEEVKNILVDLGMTEIISHAFYSAKAAYGLGEHIEVANPLDKTQHYLRKSLLPQMAEVLKRAADAGQDAAVFEIGRVFDPKRPGDIADQQPWMLAIGVTQKVDGSRKLEEITDTVLQRLHAVYQKPEPRTPFETVRGRTVTLREFDLRDLMKASSPNFGEWNPEHHVKRNVRYREQSKFPPIKRDLSMFTPDGFGFEQMRALVTNVLGQDLALLDQSKLAAESFSKDGKTSLTTHFVFQSPERTLTKTEIDAILSRLEKALTDLGATIR